MFHTNLHSTSIFSFSYTHTEILPDLEYAVVLRVIHLFNLCANARYDGYQMLAESGFVSECIQRYHPQLRRACVESVETPSGYNSASTSTPVLDKDGKGHANLTINDSLLIGQRLFALIKTIMLTYLTLPDLTALLKYIIRPSVLSTAHQAMHGSDDHTVDNGSNESKDRHEDVDAYKLHKLAFPSSSVDRMSVGHSNLSGSDTDHRHKGLDLLIALANRQPFPVSVATVPYVSLGTRASSKRNTSAYIEIPVSEYSKISNNGSMTFTCWLQHCEPNSIDTSAGGNNTSLINMKTPIKASSAQNSTPGTPSTSQPSIFVPIVSLSAPTVFGAFMEALFDTLKHRMYPSLRF